MRLFGKKNMKTKVMFYFSDFFASYKKLCKEKY